MKLPVFRPLYFIIGLCLLFPIQKVEARGMGEISVEETETLVAPAQLAEWQKLNGKTVLAIEINGLKRTKRQVLLWMMRTQISKAFQAEDFSKDLQRLYNTGNLYDIHGEVEEKSDGLVLTINLKDKWTLLPAFGAQLGGGSNTVGGGVFDSNLLGYMVNGWIFTWEFNGAQSYDFFLNQEYFADTSYMWSVDIQDNIEVQVPKYYNGQSAGQFAWRRTQRELMIGDHWEGPWRLLFYGSIFTDSVYNNDGGFNVNNVNGLQNKLYPKLIYGKVDWNNYQEHGFELTMQPSFSNIIGPQPFYSAMEVDFKRVWITGYKDRDNLAVYLSGSSISPGGPDYQLQAGGYYNVRGYSDMREFGRSLAFANIEYRPFLYKYRMSFMDLDLVVVQGCVFSDYGSAWADSNLTGEMQANQFHPLWSAGAGIRINWVKFAGAILRLDWAQTISPNEGIGFSLGIGQFF